MYSGNKKCSVRVYIFKNMISERFSNIDSGRHENLKWTAYSVSSHSEHTHDMCTQKSAAISKSVCTGTYVI